MPTAGPQELFADSFNSYLDIGDVAARWTNVPAGSIVTGRTGNGILLNFQGIGIAMPESLAMSAGVAYRMGTASFGACAGVPISFFHTVGASNPNSVTLNVSLDGRLYVNFNGTTSTGSLSRLSVGCWYYIELQAVVDAGGASVSFIIKVNNELVHSGSVGHTPAPDPAYRTLNYAWIKGTGGGYPTYADDFYVYAQPILLGDNAQYMLRPNGDGAVSVWIPKDGGAHYTEVDEVTPDDDGSYIETNNVADEDLFDIEGIDPSAEIRAVQATHVVKEDEAGAPKFIPTYIFNGVAHDGPAEVEPSELYLAYCDAYTLNPETTLPFTPGDINSMQIGARRTA